VASLQREFFSIAEIPLATPRLLLMPRFKRFLGTKKTGGGSKLEHSDGSEAEVEQLGLFPLADNIAEANNLE